MQIFIHCKTTIHVSDVTAPFIRSTKNCTRSLRYNSHYLYRYSPPTWSDRDWLVRVPIRPRWRGVSVQVVWPVPEAAGTVFNTLDDGCCDTRNMYSSFAVNKYLHTVTSVGFLFTLHSHLYLHAPLISTNEWSPKNRRCSLGSQTAQHVKLCTFSFYSVR